MTDEEITVVEDAEVLTDETDQEALVPVEEAETSSATQFDDNDPALIPNITLPTENDITDKKIKDDLKAVFDNFTIDFEEDMSTQFSDFESFTDYSKRSMKDILDKQFKRDARNRKTNAAILTRLWIQGKAWKDNVGNTKKYGGKTVQRLAADHGYSQSFVYSMIQVAKNITWREAYLLGMRDVGSKTLRDIAAIKDDTTRHTAIREFCESYRDTANIKERDEAKRKLVLATSVGSKKDAFDGDLTANPNAKESGYTEEVDNALSALTMVKNMVDKLTNEESTNTFKAYASNYFMMSTTEGAEEQHQKVLDRAKEIRTLCAKAEDNLAVIIQELDSLAAAQIIDPE
jgi:hypothetical protein